MKKITENKNNYKLPLLKKILFSLYYTYKPFIPRKYLLFARRWIALYKSKRHRNTWPINLKASKKPLWFKKWPNNSRFAIILRHDVESEIGYKKITDLLNIEYSLGFKSAFNLLPYIYQVQEEKINYIKKMGFEVGIHGFKHDGKLYLTEKTFLNKAKIINRYIKKYNCRGFASPSSFHNLNWLHALNIEYDSSTFDTDPIEPQNDSVNTIFPFIVINNQLHKYVEIPYTLPQDFTLFILLRKKNIEIWKKKVDWIAQHGGMVCINIHPDYLCFNNEKKVPTTYPIALYTDFLTYIKETYKDQYWNVIPQDLAKFCINEYDIANE